MVEVVFGIGFEFERVGSVLELMDVGRMSAGIAQPVCCAWVIDNAIAICEKDCGFRSQCAWACASQLMVDFA